MSIIASPDGDDIPVPAPVQAWLTIEHAMLAKGASPASVIASQGMFASGYEQGITDVMRELEGVHDVMGAVAVVNNLLRVIRDVKDEAQTQARVALALRNMRKPQEKKDGSSSDEQGPGAGSLGQGVEGSDVRQGDEDRGTDQRDSGA